MIKKKIIQQILLSLEVCKVVGDEFLGWMIMGGKSQIIWSIVMILLSSVVSKFCVII